METLLGVGKGGRLLGVEIFCGDIGTAPKMKKTESKLYFFNLNKIKQFNFFDFFL